MDYFSPYIQKIIVNAIKKYLQYEADVQSKKRKKLRDNPLAGWELRIGEYRVFYEIKERNSVNILAIGHKIHNILYIRNREVEL